MPFYPLPWRVVLGKAKGKIIILLLTINAFPEKEEFLLSIRSILDEVIANSGEKLPGGKFSGITFYPS